MLNQQQLLKEFEDITQGMVETCRRKNSDYSGEDNQDPFKNFKTGEHLGIGPTVNGFLWRMTDKIARITNLTKQEAQVKDESILDTLLDLANYSILLYLYLKHKD